MKIEDLVEYIESYFWNKELGIFHPGMSPDICREIMNNLRKLRASEKTMNLVKNHYKETVKQNRSLQQYSKLFNDPMFDGLTPEEIIEAAKFQVVINNNVKETQNEV